MTQRTTVAKGSQSVRSTPAAAPAGFPLVTSVMAPDGRLNIELITEAFSMTRTQLAETVGLAKETLQKSGRREAPKTRARVTEMLEIVSRIEAWAGGRPQAMAWYRAQPISALGDRTAEAMVKSGQASMVREYLDHIAVGGFA